MLQILAGFCRMIWYSKNKNYMSCCSFARFRSRSATVGTCTKWDLGGIFISILTYRNHVHDAWSNCSLIAHELLDISWHSDVTSRNYTRVCYSLRWKLYALSILISYICQLMNGCCAKIPDQNSNLPSGFVMPAQMWKPAIFKIRMILIMQIKNVYCHQIRLQVEPVPPLHWAHHSDSR